jgi:hypothetical protein
VEEFGSEQREQISLTHQRARLAFGRFLLERSGPMVVQIANLMRLWDFYLFGEK